MMSSFVNPPEFICRLSANVALPSIRRRRLSPRTLRLLPMLSPSFKVSVELTLNNYRYRIYSMDNGSTNRIVNNFASMHGV